MNNSNHTPAVNFNEASDDEMPRLSKRKDRKYFRNKEKSIKRYILILQHTIRSENNVGTNIICFDICQNDPTLV